MASYYRSRSPGDPLIYVQEEGRWRSYAADGVIAEEGDIPDEVLAGLEEIPPEEAALVIGQMAPDAEGWQSERTVYSMPEDRAEPQAAGRRSILRRRGIQAALAIVGIIVVIAIAVAVVESCDSGGVAGPDGTSPPGGGSTSGSSTVAKVGKRTVTKEELDRRVADFEAQYPGQTPDPQAAPEQFREFQLDVLDYLITYELAKQKAKALDVTVTEEEVQSQIDSILETSFGGDQAAFDQALAKEGLTLEQVKQGYQESILLQKVYTEATKDVTAVSDADIQAYYDQNQSGTYAGKSLDEVRQEIASLLLDSKKKEVWLLWIANAKQEVGVRYGDGWGPVSTTAAPATPTPTTLTP